MSASHCVSFSRKARLGPKGEVNGGHAVGFTLRVEAGAFFYQSSEHFLGFSQCFLRVTVTC